MKKLISLVDIVKDYRKMRALNHVSLEINEGITGLLGPNGAGKSTLIKILLGLVRVTGGTGTVSRISVGSRWPSNPFGSRLHAGRRLLHSGNEWC